MAATTTLQAAAALQRAADQLACDDASTGGTGRLVDQALLQTLAALLTDRPEPSPPGGTAEPGGPPVVVVDDHTIARVLADDAILVDFDRLANQPPQAALRTAAGLLPSQRRRVHDLVGELLALAAARTQAALPPGEVDGIARGEVDEALAAGGLARLLLAVADDLDDGGEWAPPRLAALLEHYAAR